MFHQGDSGNWFTELSLVEGQSPPCAGCGKPLSKKHAESHFFDRAKSIVSFWTIRCQDCQCHHTIFNHTSVLPPAAETASQQSGGKTSPDDTAQKPLF